LVKICVTHVPLNKVMLFQMKQKNRPVHGSWKAFIIKIV
jgi:hypothetical protein